MIINGIFIQIETILITRTYAGFYCGQPSREYIINQAMLEAKNLSGGGFTEPYLLPIDKYSEDDLPKYTVKLVLTGPSKDPNTCGGIVKLVTFSDSIQINIEELLAKFIWSEVAIDFDY